MTGRTNTGGAASGGVKDAVIGVTFPEGATVSVSNGIKTYTSKDTDGNAAFSVEPGEWTVTAVSGGMSVNKTVTVTAGGWISIVLEFDLVLFDKTLGEVNSEVYGGWTGAGGGNGCWAVETQSDGSKAIYMFADGSQEYRISTVNTVDLSNYTTLTFTSDYGGDRAKTYIEIGGKEFASVQNVEGDNSLDVSGFNEPGRIVLFGRANLHMRLTDIVLWAKK